MAKSLNSCSFIGNLGRDPEIKYLPSGQAVCNMALACSDSYKDKNTGETVDKTEWVNITAWGKLAEICGEYLTKGSKVYFSGKFTTEKYEKDGQTHYPSKIVANEMLMLGGRGEGNDSGDNQSQNQSRGGPSSTQQPSQSAPIDNQFDDDIPF